MQKKTLYVEFQLYIGQGERGLLMVNPTEMIFLRTFYIYLIYFSQATLQFTCIDMYLSNLTSLKKDCIYSNALTVEAS